MTHVRPSDAPQQLPTYLELPRLDGPTYGVLRFAQGMTDPLWIKQGYGPHWEIEGDPQSIVMAKRLFPGSQGMGAGRCKFPVTTRTFGDLVWFLHRWPMRIENQDEFQKAYRETCEHVTRRQALNQRMEMASPGVTFRGWKSPTEFQPEGLAWLLANQRTLLADPMGMGKSDQYMAFLSAFDRWPALIVADRPELVDQWMEMIEESLDAQGDDESEDIGPLFGSSSALRVHPLSGRKPYDLPDAHIFVTHYGLLDSWRDALVGVPKAVGFDEIQSLRHSGTAKYSAASVIAQAADAVTGLSGTPIYNKGGEIWNVLNILEYHCLGDWDSFTREWCEGYGSEVVKDPAALGAALRREGLLIRRPKSLLNLPPKNRFVIDLQSNNDSEEYRQLVAKAQHMAREALAADHRERGRLGEMAVNSARQAAGFSKAPGAADFLRGMVMGDGPTIAFVHHHHVMDVLRSSLKDMNPVFMTGRETRKEKRANKAKFIAGETDLAIIALRATSGLDGLQHRARNVVFPELDWSPAVHGQGEDRLWRLGQLCDVNAYYLVDRRMEIECSMLEVLGFKTAQFLGIVGDTPDDEDAELLRQSRAREHMRRVISALSKGGC